jgi:hypothetical protein
VCPELEEIRCKLERITHHFSEEDWRRAPTGRWSSALILEHLLLSYLSTTLGLLKAIHSKTPSTSRPTLRERIGMFVVVGLGHFPRGHTAPKQAIPKGNLAPGAVQKINNALKTMDARLTDAERLFGSNVRVLDHPGLGPLTAQQWRRFHRTHGLYHLKQIRKRGSVRG